ncbi:hypothetical protein PF005_g11658 [Phytophthora fragariae]|uniref:HTH CENPB-type domain-containing protein n=1 Tax=Phytophthora fragariae TaxID=53985 RepID=A0A6A3FW14_9STRA|nr:hypothetical protein PF003_g20924 [Phytophthora fragariae]KAE8948637.1 hypothetical protein PF009_g1793 [Phytophthora fragariae]KAE9110570.1 hypothetical protein PF010_g11114 [Phytophthora fragariae]KAE9114973.1 hypothetical protein PF007_g10181 [Phytophthora fragariae]KAE9144184.1 hypothetical protein PF006_g10851 [Phytophthora fragariae]
MNDALKTAMRDVAVLGAYMEDGDDLERGLSDGEELGEDLRDYERLQAAVKAVAGGEMTYRAAEEAYSVSRMRIQRRVIREVRMKARNGATPVLTEGEEAGVLEAIEKRTDHAQCMAGQALAAFVRKCIEDSPHERVVPAKFPSLRWVKRFQKRHSSFFQST